MLYPVGYGTQIVTMSALRRRFEPNMHPEFARRLWAWLESEQGKVGIGSGERSIATATRLWLSNPRRFANPLNSFHCQKNWSDGKKAYAAVDLVVARGAGASHRSPTWAEGDSAKAFGLHAFIRRGGPRAEPWHLQPIIAKYGFTDWGEGNQTRSASEWRKKGSPNLERWSLPSTGPTPPPPPTGSTNIVNVTVTTIRLGDQGGWVRKMQALLTTFGQDIPCDGDFGPTTERAVKAVQSFLGIVADGVCGPTTWGVLMGIAPDA